MNNVDMYICENNVIAFVKSVNEDNIRVFLRSIETEVLLSRAG